MLPYEAADPRDPRVVCHLEHRALDLVLVHELLEHPIGIFHHAPELPHGELPGLPVRPDPADPLLPVDGAARGLKEDRQAQQRRRHERHRDHARAERDVERPLDHAVAQTGPIPVANLAQ